MRIETQNPEIYIEPLTVDNSQQLFDAIRRNSIHLMEFLGGHVDFMSRRINVERYLGSISSSLPFGIWQDKPQDTRYAQTLLGQITVYDFRSSAPEIGYWIDSGVTGRGIATLSVMTVCGAIQRRLITARVEENNTASSRVLVKCGFIKKITADEYPEKFQLYEYHKRLSSD